MGILDRIKQAARDFAGEEGQHSPRRSYENAPEPQTTAFGTIDPQGNPRSRSYTTSTTPPPAGAHVGGAQTGDEAAIDRYRYLLRTAPPEAIEQVHADAFAQLTDQQRQQVLAELSSDLPAYERPAGADPQTMARTATRAEYLRPGTMERALGGARQGPGLGAVVGGSLLGTVAGYVVGSALMSAFLAPAFAAEGDEGSGDSGDAAGDSGDAGSDAAGDFGDLGFGDLGGFGL